MICWKLAQVAKENSVQDLQSKENFVHYETGDGIEEKKRTFTEEITKADEHLSRLFK